MSVKFVVAKHSSQMLRGVRELCEALNSNTKFRSVRFETLRVYVALSSKFYKCEGCEAFVSNAPRAELFVGYTNSRSFQLYLHFTVSW